MRFFEFDGKIYPVVSGGQVVTTTVSIADGVADRANRQVTWAVTFSNEGTGFTADDITPTPSDAIVSVGGRPGSGTRSVTLTLPRLNDYASFVIDETPFGDRVLSTNLAGRTSDSVAIADATTITIASGDVNNSTRTISWLVTFSDPGVGLTIDDITRTPSDAARLITPEDDGYRVSLKVPGFSAVSGNANFVFDKSPFEDRVFATTVTLADRTADDESYNFPDVTSAVTPLPTVEPTPEYLSIPTPLPDGYQVILGNLDISHLVTGISNINRSLDDGDVYQFRISEATPNSLGCKWRLLIL